MSASEWARICEERDEARHHLEQMISVFESLVPDSITFVVFADAQEHVREYTEDDL